MFCLCSQPTHSCLFRAICHQYKLLELSVGIRKTKKRDLCEFKQVCCVGQSVVLVSGFTENILPKRMTIHRATNTLLIPEVG